MWLLVCNILSNRADSPHYSIRKIRPAQEEARRGQTTGENDDDEADEGDDDTDDEMGG